MTTDYHFAQFRLRSELALDYLRPWEPGFDRAPDMEIALGRAAPIDNPINVNSLLQVDGKGGLLFKSPEQFIMRVRDGRFLTVELIDRNLGPLMHMRVLTVPLGFMCYQLGAPPLHGGLVEICGKLIAICAPSGSGKSTLVATLLERGNTVLSDDLCLTELRSDGFLWAYPGVGTLKLLPRSAEALGLDKAKLMPEGGLSRKFILSTRDVMGTEPRVLSAVLHIAPGAQRLAITRVATAEAAPFVEKLYYRPYLAHGLPPTVVYGHFLNVLRAAPLHVLNRPDDLARAHEVAAAVEAFANTLH